MNTSEYSGFLKVVKVVFYALLALAIGYLFFTYVFTYMLPFIIAYIIALIIRPIVYYFHRKIKIPRKIITFIVLIVVLTALAFTVYFVVQRVVYELNSLLVQLQESLKLLGDYNTYMVQFQSWVEETIGKIPLLSSLDIEATNQQIAQTIYDILYNFSTSLIKSIPNILGSIAKVVPGGLVFTIALIVSTFYISFDFDKINNFLRNQMSEKASKWVTEIKSMFFDAITKYLKAYFILIVITFCELSVGFMIIDIPYTFTLAAIVSIIDILPILGTGTVLIPWAIISFITGNNFNGFALLILYGTITIIRNIIEPKIVGNSLGIYPVITLICIYLGYNLFGFAGLVLFPVSLLILKTLNDSGRLKLWKTPEPTEEEQQKKANRLRKLLARKKKKDE